MKFEIKPNVGAGMIKFGMNDKQVQGILQLEPRKFKKSFFSTVLTDVYPFCHIFMKKMVNVKQSNFLNQQMLHFKEKL